MQTINPAMELPDSFTSNSYNVDVVAATEWRQSTAQMFASDGMQWAFTVAMIVVGLVGSTANGFVLFVLVYYKQVTRNTTNAFITNQTVLDLVASLILTISMLLSIGGSYGRGSGAGTFVLCLLFGSNFLMITAVYASQAGLVIITLERYVKIVHPIGHRNRFRPWMTRVGLVLPWINGIVMYMIPISLVSEINAHGMCMAQLLPTAANKVYRVFMIVWQFLLPVAVFVFCYSKILNVIHHQGQVTSGQHGGQKSTTVANVTVVVVKSSDGASPGNQKSRDDTSSSTTPKAKLSQSERNVIKTMLLVVIFYMICWFPIDITTTVCFIASLPVSFNTFLSLMMVAYVNVLLNPAIYGAHFDVVKRTLRVIRACKLETSDGEDIGSIQSGDGTRNSTTVKTLKSR